jgi:hypothetical protein
MDSPQPIEAAWSMQRIERCLALIWSTAVRIAERGVPCVTDVGLSKRRVEPDLSALQRSKGLSTQLHFVDVPAQERWRRVEERNRAKGGSLPFNVTREMFDFVESLREPPTDAELAASNGVRISRVAHAQESTHARAAAILSVPIRAACEYFGDIFPLCRRLRQRRALRSPRAADATSGRESGW